MNIVTVVIGLSVVATSFGFMIWGQRYLGEEQGRTLKTPGESWDSEADGHVCAGCGSCVAINSRVEKEADKGKSNPADRTKQVKQEYSDKNV